MKHQFLGFLIIYVWTFGRVESYSFMVPQESCYSMMPLHNNSRQAIQAPYQIIIPVRYFSPSERVRVSLVGLGNARFSGFLLQARLFKTNIVVGEWAIAQSNEFIGILKCIDKNNSLVHAWPEFYDSQSRYFTNVTADWIAPTLQNWNIEFIATVVQSYDKFWTGLTSEVIIPRAFLLNKAQRSTSQYCILALLFTMAMKHLF